MPAPNLFRALTRHAPSSTYAIRPKATNYFNDENVKEVKQKLLRIHKLFREMWPTTNNQNKEEMSTIKNTTNVENLRKLVAKELAGAGLFGKNINFAGRRMSTDNILRLLNKKIGLMEKRVKAYQEFQKFQRQELKRMLSNEKTNSFQKLTELGFDPQTIKQILFFNIARRINNNNGSGKRVFEFSIPNTKNQNVVLEKFQINARPEDLDLLYSYKPASVSWPVEEITEFVEELKRKRSIPQCSFCPEEFTPQPVHANEKKIVLIKRKQELKI